MFDRSHSGAALPVTLVVLLALITPGVAASEDPPVDLGKVGAKLSNPVSDVWALFTEFDLSFSDGNANRGDDKLGSAVIFQPILPVPLAEGWKVIVRPTIPVQFVQPQPDGTPGLNNFDYEHGLGDILLPLPFSPELDNWIVALGPTFTIPSSTSKALGRQQWAMGPSAVLGYKTPEYVVGVFSQYFWGVGDRGDQKSSTRDASYMSLLYFGFINLPNAWQIGFNPSITYDDKATSGNKWNVPLGMGFSKTVRIGKVPTKLQFGVEYSVVSQDDFGKKALIKLNVIPVIPSLMKSPIF